MIIGMLKLTKFKSVYCVNYTIKHDKVQYKFQKSIDERGVFCYNKAKGDQLPNK